MRVGVTLAVVGAIVGEWAGAERGLGVLINLARGSLFDIPLMFATLLTIALVGIVAVSRRRRSSSAGSSAPASPAQVQEVPCPVVRRRRPRPRRRPRRCLRAPAAARPPVGRRLGLGRPSRRARPAAAVARPAADRADRRAGLHPERPVRPVLPADQAGYYEEAGLEVDLPEQDRPRPHHARRAGRHRCRHRRRHERHPGGQPGHPGALRRHDLWPVPVDRVRQGLDRHRRRRPTWRARSWASRAATVRRGSCSRRCSPRPA